MFARLFKRRDAEETQRKRSIDCTNYLDCGGRGPAVWERLAESSPLTISYPRVEEDLSGFPPIMSRAVRRD